MAGRPNKYEENVKPRFKEILEWLKAGASDKDIYRRLGISKESFCKYKREYSDFSDLLKKGRKNPVDDIKNALFRRATGFNYQEKKQIVEEGHVVREEIYTKTALPDPVSALMLLKHWDTETEWSSDPAMLKLRREEFEQKKKVQDREDF